MIIVTNRQGVPTVGEASKTIALPVRSVDPLSGGYMNENGYERYNRKVY